MQKIIKENDDFLPSKYFCWVHSHLIFQEICMAESTEIIIFLSLLTTFEVSKRFWSTANQACPNL